MSGVNKGSVAVDQKMRVVKVGKDGGSELLVRRLRRHDFVNCAAKVRLGKDEGTNAKYIALATRLALACPENRGRKIVDPETDQEIKVTFTEEDEVGVMVTWDVYSSLTAAQVNEVLLAAQGEGLNEEQLGNS